MVAMILPSVTEKTQAKASAAGATLVDKQTLFRDLVLSGRTRGLIGAPEFALMKPNARFVNTSRGPIVDEAAPHLWHLPLPG
jgi:phosphoglycerate dehydrogenase-like enzyme